MRLASFTAIASALQEAGVRYLIAGGMAANAHGYARFTKHVDVVVQLAPANIQRAFIALATLGHRPAVPVRPEQFAEPQTRAGWIRDKGMQVLQLWSDAHPETPIDMKRTVGRPQDLIDVEHLNERVKDLG